MRYKTGRKKQKPDSPHIKGWLKRHKEKRTCR